MRLCLGARWFSASQLGARRFGAHWLGTRRFSANWLSANRLSTNWLSVNRLGGERLWPSGEGIVGALVEAANIDAAEFSFVDFEKRTNKTLRRQALHGELDGLGGVFEPLISERLTPR